MENFQVRNYNSGIVNSDGAVGASSQQISKKKKRFENLSRKAQAKKRRRLIRKSRDRIERRQKRKAMKLAAAVIPLETRLRVVCSTSGAPFNYDNTKSNAGIMNDKHLKDDGRTVMVSHCQQLTSNMIPPFTVQAISKINNTPATAELPPTVSHYNSRAICTPAELPPTNSHYNNRTTSTPAELPPTNSHYNNRATTTSAELPPSNNKHASASFSDGHHSCSYNWTHHSKSSVKSIHDSNRMIPAACRRPISGNNNMIPTGDSNSSGQPMPCHNMITPAMAMRQSSPHCDKKLSNCTSSGQQYSNGMCTLGCDISTSKLPSNGCNTIVSTSTRKLPSNDCNTIVSTSDLQSCGLPSPDQYVALDCEFVEVTINKRRTNGLARCSIVDYDGYVVFDVYVKPEGTITDYRTRYSGIRPHHMRHAVPFKNARLMVVKAIKNKIVVGHAVMNDFKALRTFPPRSNIRDTSYNIQLRQLANFNTHTTASLKRLTLQLLGYKIQGRTHCSVEDARATMSLFKLVRLDLEKQLAKDTQPQTRTPEQIPQRNNNNRSISESSEDYLSNDRYWPS